MKPDRLLRLSLALAGGVLLFQPVVGWAWDKSDLVTLPEQKELRFPDGFEVVDAPSQSGTVLKTESGPASATIAAYLDSEGARYYITDWSFERFRSQSLAPNWIRGAIEEGGSPKVAASGGTGYKKAFVVGVADYQAARKLRNAGNDADLMAVTLKGMGFEIHGGAAIIDPTGEKMQQAFDRFVTGIDAKSEAVIYFAGHGIQAAGENLLLPADFDLPSGMSDAQALKFAKLQCLSLGDMLGRLGRAGGAVSIVFLDCCRDTGFIESSAGLVTDGGLADPGVSSGDVLVGYAAKHGQKAFDGTGANGPFAESLAKRIQVPGQPLGRILNEVTAEVMTATEQRQQPFFYGSLSREVYLAGAPAGVREISNSTATVAGGPETVEELVAEIETGMSRDEVKTFLGEPKRSMVMKAGDTGLDHDLLYDRHSTDQYGMQVFYGKNEDGNLAVEAFTVHLHLEGRAIPIYRGHRDNVLFVLGKSTTRDVWVENGDRKPERAYEASIGSRSGGAMVGNYYFGRKGHYNQWLVPSPVTDFDTLAIDADAPVTACGVVADDALSGFISYYVGTPISLAEE